MVYGEIPFSFICQVQIEMLCLGPRYQQTDLVVMHRCGGSGGKDGHYVQVYPILRDEALIGELKEKAKEMWSEVMARREKG